jgi:hypothetical protein
MSSGFSRLRNRSRSKNRASSRVKSQDDEPEPPSSSDRASTSQIAEVIERHQLALKMDVIDMIDSHEKDIKFWKNKALKLKKKLSQ